MARRKRKAVTDEVSNDDVSNHEVKPRAKPRPRKKQAVIKTKNSAVKALIRKNAATSPLLRMPSEVRENILIHLVGGNLIHIKYLEGYRLYNANKAMHEELHGGTQFCYDSDLYFCDEEPSSDDEPIAIPEAGVGPLFPAVRMELPKSGLRHAICVASQSELSAYEEAISGYAVVPKGQMAEYYIASCNERHAACKMCGSGPMYLSEADGRALRVDLNVLGTCRQLYEEANHLLWTTNTFSFEDPKSFEKFFGSLNPAQKRNLTSVHIGLEIGRAASWHDISYQRARWDSNYWGKALKMSNLKMLRGVQAIHLSLNQGFHCVHPTADSDEVALQIEKAQEADMESILRLRALSVKHVTVTVSDDIKVLDARGISKVRWTALKKNEYAESIRVQIVDPSGADHVKTEVEAAILARKTEVRDRAAFRVKTYQRVWEAKQADVVRIAEWAECAENKAESAAEKADRFLGKSSKKAAKLQREAEKQKERAARARDSANSAAGEERRWREHVAGAKKRYKWAMARLGATPEEIEDEEEADRLMEGLDGSDMEREEDDISQAHSSIRSEALISSSDENSSDEED